MRVCFFVVVLVFDCQVFAFANNQKNLKSLPRSTISRFSFLDLVVDSHHLRTANESGGPV